MHVYSCPFRNKSHCIQWAHSQVRVCRTATKGEDPCANTMMIYALSTLISLKFSQWVKFSHCLEATWISRNRHSPQTAQRLSRVPGMQANLLEEKGNLYQPIKIPTNQNRIILFCFKTCNKTNLFIRRLPSKGTLVVECPPYFWAPGG